VIIFRIHIYHKFLKKYEMSFKTWLKPAAGLRSNKIKDKYEMKPLEFICRTFLWIKVVHLQRII